LQSFRKQITNADNFVEISVLYLKKFHKEATVKHHFGLEESADAQSSSPCLPFLQGVALTPFLWEIFPAPHPSQLNASLCAPSHSSLGLSLLENVSLLLALSVNQVCLPQLGSELQKMGFVSINLT
jgi:hypothetical protein